jgi:Family of unknown function (DUF5670)
VLPYLRGVSPAMLQRLNRFTVFRYTFSDRLIVSEIVAHVIPRKNFRRHQARVDIPAVITQNKFIEAGLSNGPIFLGRHEDRLARRAFRSAKNKGVDAIAFEHLDVRQLARLFLHHDSGGSDSNEINGEQKDKEKFKAHRNEFETVNRVVVLSNPAHQQFPTGANLENLYAQFDPRARSKVNQLKGKHMLWTIFVILLILWLLGFIGHFGGALIHLLLVIAVIVLIVNLISGRRSL